MEIRVLTARDVISALPMPEAIKAVKKAFSQFSAGKAVVPLRSRIQTERGITLLMPGYLQETQEMALKAVSVFDGNPDRGLPTVTAVVLVFDPTTGIPMALMDGTNLTAIRTGAAGGLATELLARHDANRVTLFGAGVQGRSQLRAVMTVRKIGEISIIDTRKEAAERLAGEIKTWPEAPVIRVLPPIEDAVRHADIIITATTSTKPLFNGQDLKPGTHITAIGAFTPEMQEIDQATVDRARVIVDSREACLAEAGDLIKTNARIEAEIGEIINGQSPPRQTPEEITLFKTVGLAVQDAATASAIMKRAGALNLGISIELSS